MRLADGLAERPRLSVLFSPTAVFVVDIFRALSDFEDHYDVMALDVLEGNLCRQVDPLVAKGLVSDALLLAFGLRRERMCSLEHGAPGCRRGTADEVRLYGMIAASYWHDHVLAAEAAAALRIRHARPLLSLAFDVARRLEQAGVMLDAPNIHLIATSSPRDASPVERRRTGWILRSVERH